MSNKKYLAYLAAIYILAISSTITAGCSDTKEETTTVNKVTENYDGMTNSELDKFVEQMLTLDKNYYDKTERKDVDINFNAEEEQYINDVCSYVNTNDTKSREIYKKRLLDNENGRKSLQKKFYLLDLYLNQDYNDNLNFETPYNEQFIYENENYMQQISCESLSNELSYSTSYIQYVFKKEGNTTIKAQIIKTRLGKAKHLLSHSQISITDIAFACGFSDSNYFSTAFKNKYGISPMRYRSLSNKQI